MRRIIILLVGLVWEKQSGLQVMIICMTSVAVNLFVTVTPVNAIFQRRQNNVGYMFFD
jgi:hypothetical protein